MFEIKSTTIQTARDKLTIQFSPEEVHKTIKKFTELDKNSIMNEFTFTSLLIKFLVLEFTR